MARELTDDEFRDRIAEAREHILAGGDGGPAYHELMRVRDDDRWNVAHGALLEAYELYRRRRAAELEAEAREDRAAPPPATPGAGADAR